MTQSIVIQVGQCGNQIGHRFWDLALREYAHVNKTAIFNQSMSSFFRHIDSKTEKDIPIGKGQTPISSLKARAVLVDMEDGVVNQLMKGPLKEVFDTTQLLTSHSGSGNNWATGFKYYGNLYKEELLKVIHKAAENCDCLQTFFLIHSIGGGTGSGLGTFILNLLQDEYPEVYRFVIAVYPSHDDDIITSPYNTVLATRELTNAADCVISIENQSLINICNRVSTANVKIQNQSAKAILPQSSLTCSHGSKKMGKPFDLMNNIVSNLLLNLTSSSRFKGSLNVDLNEIAMNLVPYPQLHYLISSMVPLYSLMDVNLPPRRLDEMFTEAFLPESQLIRTNPSKRNVYLACALLARGKLQMSDIRRNITRLQSKLNFIPWNMEGWKTGLCSVPPIGQKYSLLTLSNSTCIQDTFQSISDHFNILYRRKAHLHHYLQVDNMEQDDFEQSISCVTNLISEYKELKCFSSDIPFDLKIKA